MSAGAPREAERALAALVARGRTVAVAESLTGGLTAAALTAVPGASRVVRGGVTAYATEVKREVLGVDGGLLAERGAVDPDVALGMARGVRTLLAADWGLATTGVAGPDPQDGRPVGTVFVAAAGPDGTCAVRELALDGGREAIRTETVRAVLGLLLDELTGNAGAKDTEHKGGNGCLQP
ncbi:CinA family protein [Streptomyces sp. URMC 126]|uniref:CinA family protein n=1 Tax=Streptomyces sp. URMC 126 TaxID=3423401 RepID=UPI003F1B8624